MLKRGYYDEAQQEANRLSTAIYSNDNEKDLFWSNSSINLLNVMIFSQLYLAECHKEESNFIGVILITYRMYLCILGYKDIKIQKKTLLE